MPPKKNLIKKSFYLKPLLIRAINSIVVQCKVNNYLLNCGKKSPYIGYEKRGNITKFIKFRE